MLQCDKCHGRRAPELAWEAGGGGVEGGKGYLPEAQQGMLTSFRASLLHQRPR